MKRFVVLLSVLLLLVGCSAKEELSESEIQTVTLNDSFVNDEVARKKLMLNFQEAAKTTQSNEQLNMFQEFNLSTQERGNNSPDVHVIVDKNKMTKALDFNYNMEYEIVYDEGLDTEYTRIVDTEGNVLQEAKEVGYRDASGNLTKLEVYNGLGELIQTYQYEDGLLTDHNGIYKITGDLLEYYRDGVPVYTFTIDGEGRILSYIINDSELVLYMDYYGSHNSQVTMQSASGSLVERYINGYKDVETYDNNGLVIKKVMAGHSCFMVYDFANMRTFEYGLTGDYLMEEPIVLNPIGVLTIEMFNDYGVDVRVHNPKANIIDFFENSPLSGAISFNSF